MPTRPQTTQTKGDNTLWPDLFHTQAAVTHQEADHTAAVPQEALILSQEQPVIPTAAREATEETCTSTETPTPVRPDTATERLSAMTAS